MSSPNGLLGGQHDQTAKTPYSVHAQLSREIRCSSGKILRRAYLTLCSVHLVKMRGRVLNSSVIIPYEDYMSEILLVPANEGM